MRHVLQYLIFIPILVVVAYLFPFRYVGDQVSMIEIASIRAAMLVRPRLWFKKITVEVSGRTAILTGNVRDQAQSDQVERLILSINTIDHVRNNLFIGEHKIHSSETSTMIQKVPTEEKKSKREDFILRQVKEILRRHKDTAALAINLQLQSGTLTLRSDTLGPIAKIHLQIFLTEIHGINNVVFLPRVQSTCEKTLFSMKSCDVSGDHKKSPVNSS